LFQALVYRARAERAGGRIGQRVEALKAIRAAARVRVTPELRTEAMAALGLSDAERVQEGGKSDADNSLYRHFHDSLPHFSRLDRQAGVEVWRISNGREEIVTRLPAPPEAPFWGHVMSPDGRFVACAFGSTTDVAAGGVRVWKVDGPESMVLEPEPGAAHDYLAFHPSGRQLAIGHPDKGVSVYDLTTGRRTHRLAG